MHVDNDNTAQGHWLLAKMGKKVLRPGGKELTLQLVEALSISDKDEVVEFAPGLGFTAERVIKKSPASYVGIDADIHAVNLLNKKFVDYNIVFVQGNAAHSEQSSASKDKVYGEAMLTMHADHRKVEIIREAHRILKKGGLYGIHELGLIPDTIDAEKKATIQRSLAEAIKVNARPLSLSEWKDLLTKEGFRIVAVTTNAMRLLELRRMIADEGFLRFLKIVFNILTHADARRRILKMRSVFKQYKHHLNAVAIVAEKV